MRVDTLTKKLHMSGQGQSVYFVIDISKRCYPWSVMYIKIYINLSCPHSKNVSDSLNKDLFIHVFRKKILLNIFDPSQHNEHVQWMH